MVVMLATTTTAEDCCVKVAVHIRPLIGDEKPQACQDCVAIVPGKPQVQLGTHSFTFDHVYGSSGSPSSAMFEDCVSPLVDGLFQGYNTPVLAYDQDKHCIFVFSSLLALDIASHWMQMYSTFLVGKSNHKDVKDSSSWLF
ncbi:hypothetical protein LXL04_017624 [Taraxacum kok-saghyz]